MSRNTKIKTFYLNNYIAWDQFNQLYYLKWKTKNTQSANAMVQMLILASKKAIGQRQAAGAKVAQMNKTPRKKKSDLLDQYKNDDYDTDGSQDYRFNRKANSN